MPGKHYAPEPKVQDICREGLQKFFGINQSSIIMPSNPFNFSLYPLFALNTRMAFSTFLSINANISSIETVSYSFFFQFNFLIDYKYMFLCCKK